MADLIPQFEEQRAKGHEDAAAHAKENSRPLRGRRRLTGGCEGRGRPADSDRWLKGLESSIAVSRTVIRLPEDRKIQDPKSLP
jgi:hypothetical protein